MGHTLELTVDRNEHIYGAPNRYLAFDSEKFFVLDGLGGTNDAPSTLGLAFPTNPPQKRRETFAEWYPHEGGTEQMHLGEVVEGEEEVKEGKNTFEFRFDGKSSMIYEFNKFNGNIENDSRVLVSPKRIWEVHMNGSEITSYKGHFFYGVKSVNALIKKGYKAAVTVADYLLYAKSVLSDPSLDPELCEKITSHKGYKASEEIARYDYFLKVLRKVESLDPKAQFVDSVPEECDKTGQGGFEFF